VIDYPDDRDVLAQARALGIPAPVLIRDIVRIVEVLNLRKENFFGPRGVLAGSMGLRVYGSRASPSMTRTFPPASTRSTRRPP
jgi:hypothetical protein